MNRNEVLRKRYHYLRSIGFNSVESRKYSQHKIDLTGIKFKDNNKVVKNKTYREKSFNDEININIKMMNKTYNDTVFSDWGMLTHDKRYRDNTARLVAKIKKKYNLKTDDDAYYLLYVAFVKHYETGKVDFEKITDELVTEEGVYIIS